MQPANQRFPMSKHVMVIYGTRPEALLAPLPVQRCTTEVASAAAGPFGSGRPVVDLPAKPLV